LLDVSVKDTSVCIVDETGKIVRELKVASEPQALLAVLRNATYCFKRIGLEAGPLSQWLYGALTEAGLPVICILRRRVLADASVSPELRTKVSAIIPARPSVLSAVGTRPPHDGVR
jgi:transposase